MKYISRLKKKGKERKKERKKERIYSYLEPKKSLQFKQILTCNCEYFRKGTNQTLCCFLFMLFFRFCFINFFFIYLDGFWGFFFFFFFWFFFVGGVFLSRISDSSFVTDETNQPCLGRRTSLLKCHGTYVFIICPLRRKKK